MADRDRTGALLDAVAELVDQVAAANARMSEFVALTRGLALNALLFSATVQLDSNGIWSETFQVPFAAVAITDYGASLAVVKAAPPDGESALSPGVGQFALEAGFAAQVVNIAGNVLSLQAAPAKAGSLLLVQVFTRPQAPK